jgi:hypothetical protein
VSSVVDPPVISEIGGDAKSVSTAGIAGQIFEGGRDPYVILMTIYIFIPYVSSVMVGDPVRGQESDFQLAAIRGLDRHGHRTVSRRLHRQARARASCGSVSSSPR